MTTASPEGQDESWTAGVRHLAQLHAAMLAAPTGSCGELKQKMNELEQSLGITYEAAVAKGMVGTG